MNEGRTEEFFKSVKLLCVVNMCPYTFVQTHIIYSTKSQTLNYELRGVMM